MQTLKEKDKDNWKFIKINTDFSFFIFMKLKNIVNNIYFNNILLMYLNTALLYVIIMIF